MSDATDTPAPDTLSRIPLSWGLVVFGVVCAKAGAAAATAQMAISDAPPRSQWKLRLEAKCSGDLAAMCVPSFYVLVALTLATRLSPHCSHILQVWERQESSSWATFGTFQPVADLHRTVCARLATTLVWALAACI